MNKTRELIFSIIFICFALILHWFLHVFMVDPDLNGNIRGSNSFEFIGMFFYVWTAYCLGLRNGPALFEIKERLNKEYESK